MVIKILRDKDNFSVTPYRYFHICQAITVRKRQIVIDKFCKYLQTCQLKVLILTN